MKAQTVVARNIRRLRVAKGISQEALATEATVDRTYVSRLERAMENPSVGVLERLSGALECEIGEFFDRGKVARGPVAPLKKGRKPL